MWPAVFLLLVAARSGRGIESRFDEYLWTKSSWAEFKIQKPRERWRIEDAPHVYQQTQALRESGCEFVTTHGPGVPRSAAEEEQEVARSAWIGSLVDRLAADAVVFGSVCSAAVDGGWDVVEEEIFAASTLTTEGIRVLLDDVCVEAVEEVLAKYTLKKEGKEEGTAEWKLKLRQEDDSETETEKEAVEMACDRLMHHHRSRFAAVLYEAALDLIQKLTAVTEWQIEEAKGERAEQRLMDESCQDIHPRCEEWADKGECVVNPNYMLKFCKISCGICDAVPTFHKVGSFYLNDQAIDELEEKSGYLLDRLKSELCPHAHLYPQSGEHAPIQAIKSQQVLKGREIEDVTRALFLELKGKCLLLFRGWWTYEVCFFAAIRQLHFDVDMKTVLDSKLIGDFVEQRTDNLHSLILTENDMSRMGLVGERRAYIMQSYEHGDVCQEIGSERSAVIRLLCSEGLKQKRLEPDHIGAMIEEPESCHYVINIFLPLMCHYPEYSLFPSVNKGA